MKQMCCKIILFQFVSPFVVSSGIASIKCSSDNKQNLTNLQSISCCIAGTKWRECSIRNLLITFVFVKISNDSDFFSIPIKISQYNMPKCSNIELMLHYRPIYDNINQIDAKSLFEHFPKIHKIFINKNHVFFCYIRWCVMNFWEFFWIYWNY